MIKVLVIEDSATVRRQLLGIYNQAADFEVVGASATGRNVAEMIRLLQPQLISLDVFLPDESAAEIVREIRAVSPVPIVLVSNAARTSPEVFEAMAAGALDVVQKPSQAPAMCAAFLELMRIYARSRGPSPRPKPRARPAEQPDPKVLVIGASTGGPPALLTLLSELKSQFPLPILIAQHLAAGFEKGLADWLTDHAGIKVRLADRGRALAAGEVILGRPGHDLVIGAGGIASATDGPIPGLHPSADRLFATAAEIFGAGVLAVVLTGMGNDGLKGARAVAETGGTVLAQDRSSCAVYGMPAAIAKARLARVTGNPAQLGRALRDLARRGSRLPA